MRFKNPFLAMITDVIVSEINRKDVDEEGARQIARETMKMYGLSFIETHIVKHDVENETGITFI